jgi:uncharacterized metal-binding protein YceD (DUF177 family)
MYLVVDELLLKERPSWTARFDELVDLEGDGSWCARAVADLSLTADAQRVRVLGEVIAGAPRACDLCLAHYLETVRASVGELCLVDGGEGLEASWDEDNEVWHVGLGGRIDVTEMVRQALVLALPTAARCGENCVGATLSEPRAERGPDPRWAALSRLRDV